ncbi:hypothetical protein BC831DRAFT_488909 [Entophlyctis helioformis]|nr:hypothetical protein BC831DRAFT_488909 [Entophlyctis helioformis]
MSGSVSIGSRRLPSQAYGTESSGQRQRQQHAHPSLATMAGISGTLTNRLGTLHTLRKQTRTGHRPRELYERALDYIVFPVVESQGAPDPSGSAAAGPVAAGAHASGGGGSSSSTGHLVGDTLTATIITAVHGDSIRISLLSLKKFRDKLADQIKAISKVPEASLDIRSLTFIRAGQRLLSENLAISLSANIMRFSDMKMLIAEVARVCAACIPHSPTQTPDQFDQVLFQTVRLFVSTLSQAIQSAEPHAKVISHPLFKTEDYKAVVSKFAKTASQTRQDLGASLNLADGLRDIFSMPQAEHQRFVQEARRRRNETAVFVELRGILEDLARDRTPGYQPPDFPSLQAYDSFKKREMARIQGFINVYTLRFPSVVRNILPPNMQPIQPLPLNEAEKVYKALVDHCFDAEVASGHDGSATLSRLSKAILSECAFRMRISKDYKEIVAFEAMVHKYDEGVLMLEDLYPKFKEIRKIVSNHDQMRFRDASILMSIYEKIQAALLRQVQQFLDYIHRKSLTPENCNNTLLLCTYMLKEINDEPLWQERYIEAKNPEYLKDNVRREIWEASIRRYHEIYTKLERAFADKDQQILRLTKLLQAVKSDLTKYRTYFPDTFFGDCQIHLIAGEAYLKTVNGDILNISFLGPDADISQMLDLYMNVRDLFDLCVEANIPLNKNLEVDSLFAPYIDQWLTRTDQKWIEWVVRAYELDKAGGFEPVLPPMAMNSTSVLDLFASFQSGLDFMTQFNFTDSVRRDQLARNFIKAMSKALQEYCRLMFADFDRLDQSNADKILFTREHCTQSNNIFAAQMNLRKVLDALKVSEKAAMVVSPTARRIMPFDEQHFDIKIIRATGIAAKNWTTSDPYVTVKVNDEVLGSTRVANATVNPVWNDVAPVTIPLNATDAQATLFLTVMHNNSFGFDVECGASTLSLNDATFQDFLSHDLQLDLNPGIGEIDDTAWYIQRAEEMFYFAIEDMLRIYVGQVVKLVKTQLPTDFFNANADRRFEAQLLENYPHLRESLKAPQKPVDADHADHADAGDALAAPTYHHFDDEHILHTLETVMMRIPPVAHLQATSSGVAMPPAASSAAAGGRTTFAEEDRRQIQIIERVVEFLKAPLETPKYLELRSLIDASIAAFAPAHAASR